MNKAEIKQIFENYSRYMNDGEDESKLEFNDWLDQQSISSPAAGLPTEWPDSKECERVASEETGMEKMDWNDLRYQAIAYDAFLQGVNWLRSRLKEGRGEKL